MIQYNCIYQASVREVGIFFSIFGTIEIRLFMSFNPKLHDARKLFFPTSPVNLPLNLPNLNKIATDFF